MKKIIYLSLMFLVFGCSNLSNTPQKQVESFLKKYQTLDKKVLSDLSESVNSKDNWTNEQKEKYEKIMKRQYQNLVYKIKDEVIDGDSSVVTVEIEVTNLKNKIVDSQNYLDNNPQDFYENDLYSHKKYIDHLLNELQKENERVRYTLNISLSKTNKKWHINTIPDSIYDKINGVYNKQI